MNPLEQDQLIKSEQAELSRLERNFIRAVLKKSGVNDGYEFNLNFSIKSKNGHYFIAKRDSDEKFAGISSTSQKVITELFDSAVANFDR